MSLSRIVVLCLLSCNVYSLSYAADPVTTGPVVTVQNISDRSKKVLDFAQEFPTRVLTLYKNFDESLKNFEEVSKDFKTFSDHLNKVYKETFEKELGDLQKQVKEKIAFEPAQTFLIGLVKTVEEKLSLPSYLAVLKAFLKSAKTFIDTLTPRVNAELARVLPIVDILRPYVKTANELSDATKAQVATIITDAKTANDLVLVLGAGSLVPQDKINSADATLKIAEALINTINEPLQKVEPIVKGVQSISTTLVNVKRQIVPLVTDLVDKLALPIVKTVADVKKTIFDNVSNYTGWLNAGTFGVLPGVLEINKINTVMDDFKSLPKPDEAKFKALSDFAKAFTISSKAGMSQEEYERDVAYLLPQLEKLVKLLKPIANDFMALPGDVMALLKSYMKFFEELSVTKLTVGGTLFETQPFEKYRIFDVQSGASRCFARYVAMPSFSVDLGLVKLTGLSMLSSNCSLMKISDLNDSEVLKDFGERVISPGSIFKTAMSFTDRFITFIQNIPVVKDLFTRDSMKVSGVFKLSKKRVGPEAYIGTKLQADITRSVDFKVKDTKIGTLKLKSLGIEIIPGTLPNTANLMLPVKGVFDFSLLANFPTLDVAMVYDVQNLAGTLSGIFKGTWKDIFNIKGLNFSDPGLSITLSKAGIAGAGVTASMALAGKMVGVKGIVDFTNPKDLTLGFVGTFEGGLSISDIALMHAELAKQAGLVPFSLDEIKKYIPEIALRECKVVIMPKPMVLFGKIYGRGMTITGKAKLFNKECEVFINVSAGGLYGTISIDPLDFTVLKMEGLGADKKLKFALSLDKGNTSLAGLYCDANISIAAPPFTLANAKGKVYLAPALLRVTGLEMSLAGAGKVSFDAEAGFDLNRLPTDLGSIPYKFKAVLKPDSIKSLSDSFQGAFNKMSECFK